VILAKGEVERTTFATIRTWYSGTGGAGVAFYSVPNNEHHEILEKIRNDEEISGYIPNDQSYLGQEEAYPTYGDHAIINQGLHNTSASGVANILKVPVGALRRYRIEQRVANLEQSLDIIEQAAVDSSLNPVLALRLATESSLVPQTVAK
jgi:hypothetical protein